MAGVSRDNHNNHYRRVRCVNADASGYKMGDRALDVLELDFCLSKTRLWLRTGFKLRDTVHRFLARLYPAMNL